ncbi:MAG: cell division protein FtsZ [Bacteroidales bacterium]|nr:cell division protein FtsZ [Bacteroidales bacterium]
MKEPNNFLDFAMEVKMPSIIKVIGVGGGGCNAVNYMYQLGIKDVDFVVCNTDIQALSKSPVPIKIQLGQTLTEGLGAGSSPEKGKQAAIESLEQIKEVLANNTKMIFITAGMGGGTGTGAAPIIAKTAKEMGILTVAIVTLPFEFEGKKRLTQAIDGIREIKNHVDSLLIINNQRLREIYGDLQYSVGFSKADDVLATAAKGIAEIITLPGHINVDFADVKTVMTNSGVAIMGTGIADGEARALIAIKQALNSPLLNNNDIRGARNILLNITCGDPEITIDEISQITEFLQDSTNNNAEIIFGVGKQPQMGDKISVTIIATGFGTDAIIPEPISKDDTIIIKTSQVTENVKVINPQQEKIDFPKIDNNDNYNINLHDDNSLDMLEKIPAYKRKNGQYKINTDKLSQEASNISITSNNQKLIIKENNSFLHDNVD